METPEVDRILASASAQFEAALAAQEDAAADDLALSLRQGSDLGVLLSRSPWLLRRPGGAAAPVTYIGVDLVIASSGSGASDDLLVPMATARFVAGDGAAPRATSTSFLAALRREVRRGAKVRIWLGDEPIDGRLKLVTETHVILARATGQAVLPLSDVREVQLVG